MAQLQLDQVRAEFARIKKFRLRGGSGNKPYRALLVQILSKDELGRPRDLRALYDEETIHLEGGEEFAVVFVEPKTFAPHTKGSA